MHVPGGTDVFGNVTRYRFVLPPKREGLLWVKFFVADLG